MKISWSNCIKIEQKENIMKAVKIRENIYWVGGIDWDLRNFHGYMTQRGSTYNAYLIIDEKITLIDTVKSYLYPEMIQRISSIIDPSRIDYVIANHVEMDHSGSMPELMSLIPNATVYTSAAGEKGLRMHYKKDWNFKIVDGTSEISTGKNKLKFVMTPMVHWPDNMLTYLENEKILFSNDAFGQHISSSERFDDEYPLDTIKEESKKYYANIVLPYGIQVQKALEMAGALPIEIIAPSHGIIWRTNIPEILKLYTAWSSNKTAKKAVIVYDSMWGSTKKMAYAISDAFEQKGIAFSMYDLKLTHISDIMTDIIEAEYICVGSPTLNNNILPTVSAFLTYMKGLAPKGRKAMAFGSFGWGGQSVGIVEEILASCKFEILKQQKIQYIPDENQLKTITEETASLI
jgi:flavorubredoxin